MSICFYQLTETTKLKSRNINNPNILQLIITNQLHPVKRANHPTHAKKIHSQHKLIHQKKSHNDKTPPPRASILRSIYTTLPKSIQITRTLTKTSTKSKAAHQ
ncbi:hypothetical protein CDL12_09866 [Handroanthus impetiginosus]|uniref:Uncharacterized protein n=1 Tax=Handroanthus impetiginosus TaxID=429701 RepID=A0A2G9HIY1_9LAMI|nr:hypothetical protein CDL12_09866 [Handroanthus impetiginosus]